MASARAQALREILSTRQEEIWRLLRDLVEAESPSRDPGAHRRALAVLERAFEPLGFRLRRLPGSSSGGVLLAVPGHRRRGRPIQVAVGHCDTVWPIGTLETMPVTLRDGRMTGPGVYDMKAGLVMTVFALAALRDAGIEPQVTPVVLINSDEEVGSSESKRVVKRLAAIADRVLVLEPAFGRRGKLKTARKGVGQFTIRVQGKAAHAGLAPGEGVSAILELSLVVQKLFALNDPEAGITVNVGTIDGGLGPNVVAPESSAVVDVRVETREQAREIERRIRALTPETRGALIEVEGEVGTPPLKRTPRNRALWRLARKLARELDLEIQQCHVGGASDGNTASLYAPTLDGLGAIGGGAHARHEFVEVDSLVERGALLALLLAAPPLNWRDLPGRTAGERAPALAQRTDPA